MAIEIDGCLGEFSNSTGPAIPDNWEEYGGWPVWVSLSGGVIYVVNSQLGITTLQIVNTLEEPPVYEDVIITTTNCDFEEVTDCLSYPLNIVWLNPDGGFSSYTFNAKKKYGVEIGGSSTWKDSNRITRYNSIDDIFDSVIQASGYIPETHVDLLKSLRYSMQAWVVTPGTPPTIQEIFNYAKSYDLKDQGTGFFKYDFDFNYSSEILTQC